MKCQTTCSPVSAPETDALRAKYLLSKATETEWLTRLWERLRQMEKERNVWKHEAELVRKQLESEHELAISLFIEFHELKNAVAETLEENRHLAAGDQCTLKKLKDAYAKAGASLDSENAELSRGDRERQPDTKQS